MLTLRAVLPALVAAGCCVSCPFDARAAADAYPGKPIRLIVPFPPGGGVDGAARIVGQRLADALGQQIVIDNRGGSGGIIAAEIAAKAVPDGYTLFFGGSASHGIAPHLYPKLAYDAERDFAAIVLIGATPYILVVHPAVPATTVKELIALAVTSAKRTSLVPELPTVAEAGVPGFEATGWYGLLGPRGLPPQIVATLNQATLSVLGDREFVERYAVLGIEPLGGTPSGFAGYIHSELAKWGKVVRESGARVD